MAAEEVHEIIYKSLEVDGFDRVVLAGKAGIGKTYVANEACKLAVEKGSCYLALWLHLNKKFDEKSLYKDIAAQLCLFHEYEETEDDDGTEKEEVKKEDVEEEWKIFMADIKKTLTEKKNQAEGDKKSALSEGDKKPDKGGKNLADSKKSAAEKKTSKGEKSSAEGDNKPEPSPRTKYLLLILNDEGSVTKEEEVMTELKLKEFLKDHGPIKTLVTRRKVDDSSTSHHGETEADSENVSGENETVSEKSEPDAENDSSAAESSPENGSGEIQTVPEKSEPDAENNSGGDESATENKPGENQAATENNTGSNEPVSQPRTMDVTQALLASLTEDKMEALLKDLTKEEHRYLLEKTWGINGSTLKSTIVKRSLCLPAAVVVLAKSLNCIAPKHPNPEEYIKQVFREVVPFESQDAASGSESTINPCNYVLHLGYKLLKRSDDSKDRVTFDCFWHSLDFFMHCGGVYYRDLIMHWILEGYFDPVISVEKAYQEGHSVLMDFVNRGILKIQENNVVVPEVAMNDLIDLRDRGFFGTSHLGFSRVYGGDKTKGLGRTTVVDDMVKTVQTNKKKEKLSTILVSGDRLRRETPQKFFKNKEMEDLEVLGLFNPALDSLVGSLSEKLQKLRFLMIRDYDLLEKIDELKHLSKLQVLEVSGASSLDNIPDDFFEGMTKLESLNLSGLRIKFSPSSISKLTKLRCLILRDCPELEDLPEIQHLDKLEVIDLRGARELKTCFDHERGKDKEKGEDRDKDKGQAKDKRQDKEKGTQGDKSKAKKKNKSKNKNFFLLRQLQLLDLSESQVERLPIFQNSAEAKQLSSLARLVLRNCRNLRRLPNLKPLSGLQVLDLSGTSSLVEMLEVCFEEKKELRILNLSGTNLGELPSTISELSNLTKFLLKDCRNLKALPNIEELTRLEVFDVSGSTILEKIDGSFKHMSYLRELNLCGTRLKTIPELPEHSSLCCSKYIVLPDSSRKNGENWTDIKQGLPSGTFESASSSDAGAKTSEISEQESGQEQECYHDDRYEAMLKIIRQFVHESLPKIEKIPSCSDPSELSDNERERISKAEFVSFVDNISPSVSSVFDAFQMTSLKGCWVNRCKKMENLFSGEHEKHVESLETLWVSNLPLLKSLYSGSPEQSGFKNLQKLSIDCCSNIVTLFPASQLPTSLEELHIKYCDKLEKVFDPDGELPNLKMLHLLELPVLTSVGARLPELSTFTKLRCPKLVSGMEDLKLRHTSEQTEQEEPCENPDSDWIMVDRNEAAP